MHPVERGSEVASPTIQDIISDLRSSFFGKEFQSVAETLVKREEHMNDKYIDLKRKSESFEKEKDAMSLEILKLNDQLKKKQTELNALQKEISGYKEQIKVLNSEKCRVSKNLELEDELKKKQSEIDKLRKLSKEYERRARVYKKQFLDLGERVSNLEISAKELVGSVGNISINLENNQQKDGHAESSRPVLRSEKTDCDKRTEPNPKDVIQIQDDDDDSDVKCISTLKRKRDSKLRLFCEKSNSCKAEPNINDIIRVEDDDDDDLKCISTLKRKRSSYEIKREHNTNDDGLESISALKAKRISNEIERKINADCVGSVQAGSQRSKIRQELHDQPLPFHRVSTPRSEGIMPDVKKPMQKNDHLSHLDTSNPTSGQDTEKFDEAFKSVIAKIKTRRERWKSKDDMLKEFDKDDELCMNAICALHRQSIRGKLTSSGVIVDLSRITQLGELLTDGDPHRKLKKTASELKHTDLDDCRKFARRYSAQLFDICQTKTKYDPFFPPSSSKEKGHMK